MEQMIDRRPKKVLGLFLKNFKVHGWKIVFGILVAYIVFLCYGAFSPEVSILGERREEVAVKVFYDENKMMAQQKLVDEASKLTPSRTKEIQNLESSLASTYDRDTYDGYVAIQKAIWKKQREDTEESLNILKQKNRVGRQANIIWDTFMAVNNKGVMLIYNAIYHKS